MSDDRSIHPERKRTSSSASSSGYHRPIGSFKLRSPSSATSIAPALFRQPSISSTSQGGNSDASIQPSRRKSLSEEASTLSASRICKRLVIHGKPDSQGESGCHFDVFIKISIPPNSSSQVVPLFSQDPSRLLSAELQPFKEEGISPQTSLHLLDAARSLGIPIASPFSPVLGENADTLETQLSIVQQGSTVGLAIQVPDENDDIDDSFRALSKKPSNWLLATKLFVPLDSRLPEQANSVALPLPSCLFNSLYFALPRLPDTEYDLATIPSLRPFPSPSLRSSGSSSTGAGGPNTPFSLHAPNTSSTSPAISPFKEEIDDLVSGTFVSTTLLNIRWADRSQLSPLYIRDMDCKAQLEVSELLNMLKMKMEITCEEVKCISVHPTVQLALALRTKASTRERWKVKSVTGAAVVSWEETNKRRARGDAHHDKSLSSETGTHIRSQSSQPMRATFSRNESSSIEELRSVLHRSISSGIEKQPSSQLLMDTPPPFMNANGDTTGDITIESQDKSIVDDESVTAVLEPGGEVRIEKDAYVSTEGVGGDLEIVVTLDAVRLLQGFGLEIGLTRPVSAKDDARTELPELSCPRAEIIEQTTRLKSPILTFAVEGLANQASLSDMREMLHEDGQPQHVTFSAANIDSLLDDPLPPTQPSTPTIPFQTLPEPTEEPEVGIDGMLELQDEIPNPLDTTLPATAITSFESPRTPPFFSSSSSSAIPFANFTISRSIRSPTTFTELKLGIPSTESRFELSIIHDASEDFQILSAFVNSRPVDYSIMPMHEPLSPSRSIQLSVDLSESVQESSSRKEVYLVYSFTELMSENDESKEWTNWQVPSFTGLVGKVIVECPHKNMDVRTHGWDTISEAENVLALNKFNYVPIEQGVRTMEYIDDMARPPRIEMRQVSRMRMEDSEEIIMSDVSRYSPSLDTYPDTLIKDIQSPHTIPSDPSSSSSSSRIPIPRLLFIIFIILFTFLPVILPNTKSAKALRTFYAVEERLKAADVLQEAERLGVKVRGVSDREIALDYGDQESLEVNREAIVVQEEQPKYMISSEIPSPHLEAVVELTDESEQHQEQLDGVISEANHELVVPPASIDLQEYFKTFFDRSTYEARAILNEWYSKLQEMLGIQR